MQIIVRGKGTESERRAKEYAEQIKRHYYNREIRDGARFRSRAGSKEEIKKAV